LVVLFLVNTEAAILQHVLMI